MLLGSFVAVVHHLAAFAIAAALTIEFMLFRRNLTERDARRIQVADMTYGVASLFIIIVGLIRIVYFAKGTDFYLDNLFFWVKMLIFTIMGGLSIYPTIQFFSWNKRLNAGELPEISETQEKRIKRLVSFELFGLALVIASAPLMTAGLFPLP